MSEIMTITQELRELDEPVSNAQLKSIITHGLPETYEATIKLDVRLGDPADPTTVACFCDA